MPCVYSCNHQIDVVGLWAKNQPKGQNGRSSYRNDEHSSLIKTTWMHGHDGRY